MLILFLLIAVFGAFSGPAWPSSASLQQGVEGEILMESLTYWQEGEKLKNRCQSHESQEKWPSHSILGNRLLRILMNAYQFIGIDLTTRAMGGYAKALDWPREQFLNFSKNIVGEYCSPNISLFSRRELLRRLRASYREETFLLPSVVGHRSFPRSFPSGEFGNPRKGLQREFQRTTELFRSFCSWGGSIKRPRLLSFMFRDLSFSAFVMGKLATSEIPDGAIPTPSRLVSSSKEGVPISCRHSICRRTSREDFWKQFPTVWRGKDLLRELEKAYCQRVRWLPPHIHPKNSILQNWAQQTSREDRYLMHGQLRALITGIPEFLLRVDQYPDLVELLQFPYRKSWGHWVEKALGALSEEGPSYEESLFFAKINSQFYFHKSKGDFKIKFLVGSGEFDRVLMGHQGTGLEVFYPLHISKHVLRWVRDQLRALDSPTEKEIRPVLEVLKRHLVDQLKNLEKKFIIRPWRGDLSVLIAWELMAQLIEYEGDFFYGENKPQVTIPIELIYGPFALRYIYDKAHHYRPR